jgi:hypothetical protein
LFNPYNIIHRIGLDEFVLANKNTLWLVLLFSIILYLYEKFIKIYKYIIKCISRYLESKKRINKIFTGLNGLSTKEKTWIYYCLRENRKTVIATSVNSTAVSLEQKGVVFRPQTAHSIIETPFTIIIPVWNYLIKRKNLYRPENKLTDNNYNKKVNDFIKNLKSVV